MARQEQREQVVTAMLEGLQKNGYATDVWTLPRVRAMVSKHTGEIYHTSHFSRTLRSSIG
jgi:hypothetical protein